MTLTLADYTTLIWILEKHSRPLLTVTLNYASSIHHPPPPQPPSGHSPDEMLGQKGSLPSVSLPYTTLSDGILTHSGASYLAQWPTVMLRRQLHSLNHSTLYCSHNSSLRPSASGETSGGVRPISACAIKNCLFFWLRRGSFCYYVMQVKRTNRSRESLLSSIFVCIQGSPNKKEGSCTNQTT